MAAQNPVLMYSNIGMRQEQHQVIKYQKLVDLLLKDNTIFSFLI